MSASLKNLPLLGSFSSVLSFIELEELFASIIPASSDTFFSVSRIYFIVMHTFIKLRFFTLSLY
jgi:hypothetical protein